MPEMLKYALLAAALILIAAAAYLYTPDQPADVLRAKYAQPPSQFIPIAGLTLHLRDTGPRTAPAILLLHGFGSSLHTWDAWAQNLEQDHRVLRIDLPGFALTGPDPTRDYSDTRTAEIITALLDHLQISKTSLIGNSMGGRIAWTFAALHPDRTERLVLISPDGFASPGRPYDQPPSVPLLMRTLPYTLPTPLLRPMLAAAYANPATLTPTLLTRYRDLMRAPGARQAILDRMASHTLRDPRPLLSRIAAPTLLLWGEQDAMIPIANAADYQAAIPHTTLTRLPGIGHVPQEEAPETIAIVRAFLDN